MSDLGQITTEPAGESFDRCEQCHAPVDRDQRYCVNCGAHRRGVPDPAAAHMSRTNSRPPAHVGAAVIAPKRRGFGSVDLLGALALALIPVAAAVGIVIGRSSNNQDGKLIRALENRPAQTITTVAGGTGASASTAGASSPGASSPATKKPAKQTAKPTAKPVKPVKPTSTAEKPKAALSSATSKGKVTKVTGAKVTASQQTQGSSEAKKVQSSSGKNYVQADNNLPSSVVVGP